MKRAHFDSATPYIACFTILRKDGKVAFVLRENTSWMNGFYGLPAGKVENDETFSQGAIREAKEEAGVTIAPEDIKHAFTMHRKGDDSEWVDIFFEATKWQGEPFNAEPTVHKELAWLDLKNLPDNMVPSVKEALLQIEAGKIYAEYGWEKK